MLSKPVQLAERPALLQSRLPTSSVVESAFSNQRANQHAL